MKAQKIIKTVISSIIFALIAVIMLFPFFLMITRSLMTTTEAIDIPVPILPSSFYLGSYQTAMSNDFFSHLGNTMSIVICNIIGVPLSAFIVAYGFAKIKFKGSGLFFSIGMATMMIPSIARTVPLYVLYTKLGWLNTLYPFIIPQFFGGGMTNIFLIYTFLRGVPNSYCEAARIDGANTFQITFMIVAPLALPIITYVAVNTFIGAWNDFTGPLTYINSMYSERWTLAVSIFTKYRGVVTNREKEPNVQMALCVILMIPPMILFSIFQKTLISGVAISGIKG